MARGNDAGWLVAVGLVLGLVVAGCPGCPGSPTSEDPDGGGASGGFPFPTTTSSGLPGLSSSSSGNPDPVTGLEVDPASLEVTVTWGVPARRDFHAIAVRQSGAREQVSATWSVDQLLVARVNDQGEVTITAQRAGPVVITASAEGRTATANIMVRITADRVLPGAPVSAPVDFSTVTCDPGRPASPTLEYPLDNVVLPLNLPSPVLQWAGTDVSAYRLTIGGSAATVVLYLNGSAREAVIPQDLWSVLLAAHAGGTLTWFLDARVDAQDCGTSGRRTMKIASADLSATVYYWAVSVGQIMRLDVGATNALRMDIEPTDGQGGRCNACHVLSRDGQKLAFTYYGGNGPGGVVNVTDPRNPIVGPQTDRAWNYATFDPTGNLLLTNLSRKFFLRDVATGVVRGELPLEFVAMPTWSPAGEAVAFAGNTTIMGAPNNWEIDFDSSDLQTISFNASTETFGSPATLVPGAGTAISYPSYSATGSHIVYQRGPWSRSATPDTGQHLAGDLELVASAGGAPIPLLIANPEHNSYMPTFSPFVEGGYQWVAFYSRRAYGHIITDQRPQIWLAALDENVTAGLDPSHPPFWLPGQDQGTSNLSSYFAPSPCRDTGGECTSDVQCCNGQVCRPTPQGTLTCQPPGTACSLAGGVCTSDADCCPGAGACTTVQETGERICSTGGNACRMANESCVADGDCCPGAGTCRDNGQGVLLCTPGATGCRKQGESCSTDGDCCANEGWCLDSVCTIPGG